MTAPRLAAAMPFHAWDLKIENLKAIGEFVMLVKAACCALRHGVGRGIEPLPSRQFRLMQVAVKHVRHVVVLKQTANVIAVG